MAEGRRHDYGGVGPGRRAGREDVTPVRPTGKRGPGPRGVGEVQGVSGTGPEDGGTTDDEGVDQTFRDTKPRDLVAPVTGVGRRDRRSRVS